MVNMEDSKSIRSKFKKSVQTLLKPFQKKEKHLRTQITKENDRNVPKNGDIAKLSENNNIVKLDEKEDAAVETKEYRELLDTFSELGIQNKIEKDNESIENVDVKNKSETTEDKDVSDEEKIPEEDDIFICKINRQDSGDSGYDENRLLKSITQELEKLKKDNQPKKVVFVRRGPVWSPRVAPPITEPYQRKVNRQTLSGGNVVVRSQSPELTEITQEVLDELILRVPDDIVKELNEYVSSNTGLLPASNEIGKEFPELMTNSLIYPETYNQLNVQEPNLQGCTQSYTDQSSIFQTGNQTNEVQYGELMPNMTEPGYFLESPTSSLLSPDNLVHGDLEQRFENNFGQEAFSQPFLSNGVPSGYSFDPPSNSSIDLTSPNDEAFGNSYEFTPNPSDTSHQSFTQSPGDNPLTDMLKNAPDLSEILNSPVSSPHSPLCVPNDHNSGCEQAYKQLELHGKSLYYNGYYTAPPLSTESLSPLPGLSSSSNEARMDLPITSPVSTSNDSSKIKIKKNMPEYKKDLQKIKNTFITKMCCNTLETRTLCQYFNNLPDKAKEHLITITNDESLQSIQKCILKAMEGVLYEDNVDLQLAIIFYLCERVMKQHIDEYLSNFGLNVLRTSVLWCFKHPLVTYYIVQNIYTAYQISGRTYSEPIFSERDRNGDNLIIFCARAGDAYADVLAALCDVRKNCPPLFDFSHKNNEGCNALHVACITHRKEEPRLHIVHVLLNHANISIWEGENKGGMLSLHHAVNSPYCDFDLVLYHFQGLDKKDWHKLANYKRDTKGTRTTPKAMAMSRESLEASYPKDVSNFLERCKDNKYTSAVRKNQV